MGPGRHEDSLELELLAVSEAVSVGHFGLLVSRNYETQKKITSLERAKAACLKEAADMYGVDEEAFTKLAEDVRSRIIGIDELAGAAGDDGGALGEFLVLSIKSRLLKRDPIFYAKVFFPELTALTKVEGAIDELTTRRAVLEGTLAKSGALRNIGYSGEGLEWLSRAEAKSAILSAIKLEMRVYENSVEQSIMELDQHRSELKIRAQGGDAVPALKRKCSTLCTKVSRNLRPWTFWHHFDTAPGSSTFGRANAGWEKASTEHQSQLLDDAEVRAGAPRSFPWDAPEAVGSGRLVPRRTILKFLDIIYELLRSLEEFRTLLPYDLRRAVRYYLLYSGNIAAVLAKIKDEIAAQLAVLDSQAGEDAEALAVTELDELLFRREFLIQRQSYVDERVRQGHAAVANWFAKGNALQDVDSTTGTDVLAVVPDAVGVETNDEEGLFAGLPLLAAGGAARATMLERPEEEEEGVEKLNE